LDSVWIIGFFQILDLNAGLISFRYWIYAQLFSDTKMHRFFRQEGLIRLIDGFFRRNDSFNRFSQKQNDLPGRRIAGTITHNQLIINKLNSKIIKEEKLGSFA
jgi:hypothetical protein